MLTRGAAGSIGRGIQDAYELSPVQAGMLFQTRLDPASAVYVVQLWTRLSGPLDEAAFRDAWAWAVTRHPVLRTGFVTSTARPVQVVHAEATLPIHAHDWTGADEGETERRIQALAAEDRARPFDLAAPPLLRLHLARLAADEHVLLWSLHHLVLDGWSYTTLFREVLARYDAVLRGAEFDPPAPRPYKEFIGWIRGRDRAAAEAFWRAALDGVAEPTPLGIDTGPQGGDAEGYGDHNRHLSAELTAALHEAARARRVTLATLVEGAWALVLSRYAGTDDVVFGWTGSGRPESLPGAERMCGLFVNTLPARVKAPADAALGPWLRGLQEAQLAAREHEHVPLVDVQGWTEVARGRPLFESILAFENFPRIGGAGDGTGGLVVGAMRGASSTGYPLTLVVHPGERMHLRAYADRARIGGAAAERLLAHIETALRSMVDAPVDALLREIEILPADERALVLGPWAAPRRDYPEQPMHRLFAEHAAKTPQKVAVTAADGSLTYGELEAAANRLSNHLVSLGVRPGQIVAMGLDRGTRRIVTLLAIVKAGAAYLPLDAAYPRDRLAFLMDDAGARVIVTDQAHAPALPTEGRTAVLVDADAAQIAAASAQAPRVMVGADDPLYVVYTSGSTGTPKGVLLSHRALARLVRAVDYADFGADQVWMHFVALTFDTSAMEIWGALANGGRLAVFPPHQPTLDEIGAFWREQGVTTVWLTAGLFHQLIDARLDDFGVLGQVMAGGDILSVPHCRRLLQAHPELRLVNGYGPSENGTYTSAHVIRPSDLERTSIPIGRPVPCTTCYVLDGRMQPAPIGVWGELLTGGDGVALGYLNRPEMTAERFVTITLDGRTDRVYRTGDRVRWMEDGVMEFLGRSDFQVKIRGFRVEPGEVEQALQAHPAVRDAAVVARADSHGEKRLVGYFVGDVSTDDVREFLRGRLPEHMVPGAFVRMDGLPLNRHGKVDRGALPDPAGFAEDAGAEYVAPRTETEELLATLWAEVLGAGRVGVTESFFGAGGHSLQAMQLVTRVREALRVEVPLRTLFEAPSVAELAATLGSDPAEAERIERTARLARVVRAMPDAEVRALLESTAGQAKGRTEAARRAELLASLLRAEGVIAPADGDEGIVPRGDDGPAPLSFAQQRLWFLDRLQPGGSLYNVPVALRLAGQLNEPALARALGEVFRRHQVLRAVFEGDGATARQVARPADEEFALPFENLSTFADPQASALRRAAEEADLPFHLDTGPLYRARLLRVAPDEHVLLVTLHHAVSDGWSLGVLYRELSALYGAFSRGEPSPLAPLPVQYADFAVWQRAHLAAGEMDRQLAWWKQRLAGAPALLNLPTDRPRPAVQTYRGAREHLVLPPGVAEAVKAAGRREGVTLFMTLLAAYQALLSRYAGQDDVVVGTPVAGRTRPETEGLIGFFVNTLALRGDLSGDPSFRALLARVREATLGAWAHQDLPFERLVEEVQPERSMGHSPVFQALFVLQDPQDAALDLAGLRAEPLPAEQATVKFDLSLAAVDGANGLELALHYNVDLFDASTVRRMLDGLALLLSAAAEDPERRVGELPLLSDAERALIAALETEPAVEDDPRPFPARFAAQVRRTPQAAALLFGQERVTYAELDARANRLANHLRRLGIGPESRVGVCMERTPELVVALVGILGAGACYVTLEPHFPPDRIRSVLEDAGAPLLVVDRRKAASLELPSTCATLLIDDPDVRARIGAESAESPDVEIHPESLSHVIYTSGSTGKPKGVMIRHGGVAAFLAWMERRLPIAPGEKVLGSTSVCFDVHVAEMYHTFASGGVVVLVENALSLAELPADLGIVQASMVPTAAQELLLLGAIPGTIRRLNIGGEPLAPDLVRGLYAAGVGEVHNVYGPTEDTTYSTEVHVPADGPITIGRQIAASRAYVLDARFQTVPVGVVGDLYVAGAGVSRGYLARPALTAERYLPDVRVPGERMYTTGDRARWLPNGELEYFGRSDFQVKVRGFRIEPGEIEAVLRGHPGVDNAVVAARGQETARRLVAWIIPRDGFAPTAAELTEWVRDRLPAYMVPAAIMALAAFPRTSSEKVDRKALPDPDFAAAAEDAYVAPRTQTERVVAEIFGTVLGAERVGAADDFFALGGHSLLAMHVWAHVRDRCGVQLSLRALFEHPTVQALAAAVDAAPRAQPAEAEAPITARRRTVRAVHVAPVDAAREGA